MTRRQQQRSQEIMLIPFLDILCSLIGVLVLIIVVLVVAQTQRINGRTSEELQRSTAHLAMLSQQKLFIRANEALLAKVPKLAELRTAAKAQEEKLAKLRLLLATTDADRQQNQVLSQNLLKELDNLLVELKGLKTQEPALKQEVAALRAEITKRQLPAQQAPPVTVQPGGSGFAAGSKIFFIEATSGKLTYHYNEKVKGTVSAVADVIATDVGFNAYLKQVLTVPKSRLVFLLREDGMAAYNLGAGWAQATFGYRVDQVGKLPIPGRGEIDLRAFKDFLGELTPPTATPPQPKN
jgi:hypothetical protein